MHADSLWPAPDFVRRREQCPPSACGVEPATVDREAEEFRAEAVEPLELGTGWVDGDEDSGDQRHERLQRPQKLGMVYVRRDLIDLQIHAAVDQRIELAPAVAQAFDQDRSLLPLIVCSAGQGGGYEIGRGSCREGVCHDG